jgi:uncharacterized membrane protein/thiol-disulfide isomerase/thioredoxin
VKKNSAIVNHLDFWETAYEWFKKTGNKVNKNYLKEELTTHPDYPSLISLTDFLESGAMSYKALQADSSYVHKFKYPLLAHIKQSGDQHMVIIENTTAWEKQKEILDYWTGIVVYAEKNVKWQNENYILYQSNEKKYKIVAGTFIIIAFILLFIAITKFTYLPNSELIKITAFGLLSLIGIILSVAALGIELGVQNDITMQVCGAVSNGGCEKVLKSRFSKGIGGVTPADGSVLYFTTQFIIYLLGSVYSSFIHLIFIISLACIAVAAWSIYTQAIKLKQWCALCLAIAAVLVLQFVIAGIEQPVLEGVLPAIVFVLLFAFLTVVLLPVKQLIKTNNSNKIKLAELKKWKSDAEIFLWEWEKEQETDTAIWPSDLLLGNSSAPLMITVACNPYCNPCANAHLKLENLLQRFPDKIKTLVRFSSNPKDATDKKTLAVKAIIQKSYTTQNNKDLQQMLTDWFVMMNYENWVEKWQPEKTIDVENRIIEHNEWINESKIAFTPTFFLNGKKIPGRYSIDDIEILIPQLTELMTRPVSIHL